jgi:diacylglycerol kinase family enzyme
MHRVIAGTSDTTDRILIAANPRAGAGSPGGIVERLASVLRHYQFRVDVFTDLDAVTAAADRSWRAGELRALVAAGGDGTVAELVNRTAVGLPITVFPLGTANLLAGYLNIFRTFQPFARMLRRGATIRLDAGQANGRIFLLMVGCGFDAEVVERLHSTRGGHISMWSYAKPIFESIRSYQYPELRIYGDCAPRGSAPVASAVHSGSHEPKTGAAGDVIADGGLITANTAAAESTAAAGAATLVLPAGDAGQGPWTRVVSPTARWVFVVNLPCYAAKLQFAPGALGTDGQLEVATFRYGSLLQGFRYLSYLWTGQQSRLSPSDYGRLYGQHIRIEADVPVRYQLDGDPGGLLPLAIDVLPSRLTLIAPPERVAALTGIPQ